MPYIIVRLVFPFFIELLNKNKKCLSEGMNERALLHFYEIAHSICFAHTKQSISFYCI